MKIVNIRTKEAQSDIFKANSFKDKSIGLLKEDINAIFFETRLGIHSFGIKDDLFVLIFDKKMILYKIKRLKPNRIFFWNPFYKNVFEIRPKVFKLKKSMIGDKFKEF